MLPTLRVMRSGRGLRIEAKGQKVNETWGVVPRPIGRHLGHFLVDSHPCQRSESEAGNRLPPVLPTLRSSAPIVMDGPGQDRQNGVPEDEKHQQARPPDHLCPRCRVRFSLVGKSKGGTRRSSPGAPTRLISQLVDCPYHFMLSRSLDDDGRRRASAHAPIPRDSGLSCGIADRRRRPHPGLLSCPEALARIAPRSASLVSVDARGWHGRAAIYWPGATSAPAPSPILSAAIPPVGQG